MRYLRIGEKKKKDNATEWRAPPSFYRARNLETGRGITRLITFSSIDIVVGRSLRQNRRRNPVRRTLSPLLLRRFSVGDVLCAAKKRGGVVYRGEGREGGGGGGGDHARRWLSSACTYLKGLENPVALRYLSEQRMCAIKLLLYLALGAASRALSPRVKQGKRDRSRDSKEE